MDTTISALNNVTVARYATPLFLGIVGASLLGFALNPVHMPPIPDAFGALWMGLALMASIVLGLGAMWRQDRLDLPWPVLSFVGLGVAAFLSGLANKAGFAHTYGTTNLLWLFGAMGIASAMAYAGQILAQSSPDRAVRWLGAFVIVAGVMTAGIECIQYASPGFNAGGWIAAMPAGLTPYGNLMQRNHAAALLGMALLFVVYFSRQTAAPGARWTPVWAIAGAILVYGIVLTASRMGLAYVALAGALHGWMRDPSDAKARFGSAWVIVTLGLGAGLYMGLAWVVSHASAHALSAVHRFEDAGMGSRDAIWLQAWAMFRAHPMFGAGWGTFSAYALSGALTSPHPQFVNNAHDIVLQVLAETGVVGLILTGTPIALGVLGTLRKGEGWIAPPWRKLSVALCLLILGYSLVEYPLWSPLFLVPFALFWGMASAPSPIGGKMLTFGVKTTGIAFAAISIVVLVCAIGQYRAISTDTLIATVPGELQSSGFDAGALRAKGWLPLFEPEIEFLEFQSMPVNGGGDINAKIALGSRVAMHYTTPASLEKLAALWLLKGDATSAAERLAVVARMYPALGSRVRSMLVAADRAGNPHAMQSLLIFNVLTGPGTSQP